MWKSMEILLSENINNFNLEADDTTDAVLRFICIWHTKQDEHFHQLNIYLVMYQKKLDQKKVIKYLKNISFGNHALNKSFIIKKLKIKKVFI